MSHSTPATKFLDRLEVAYTLHSYDYDPDPGRVGLQAAEEMERAPARVFKTLMALVDGKAMCVLAPSDRQVNMKQLAALAGGKRAGDAGGGSGKVYGLQGGRHKPLRPEA